MVTRSSPNKTPEETTPNTYSSNPARQDSPTDSAIVLPTLQRKKIATEGSAKKKLTTKRKITESPSATTRSAAKKQRLEEEEEQKNKNKKEKKKKQEQKVEKKKKVEKEKRDVETVTVKRKRVEKKKKVAEDDMEDEETVLEKKKATHKLSPERKQRVREMGFGSLIGFPIEKVPAKLPYFILKNLDVETMEVKLPNGGVIKITPKKIREALGIPIGHKSFYAKRPRLKQETMPCRFMAQLPNRQRQRTTTALSNVIQTTEGTDFLFDLNYLMLFANCLVTYDDTAMLKYHVLENIKSPDDIPNIDWCTYIWNVLKQSKEKWNDTMLENWYYGPHLTFTAAKEEAKKKEEAEEKRKAEEKKKAEKEKAQKEEEKKSEEKRKAVAKELNEKRKKEKSPCNNKMANVIEPLTEDKTLLAYNVFSMQGEILDELFDDGKGTIVPRITMQSPSPGIQIDSMHQEIEKEKKNLKAQIKKFMDIINKDETSCKLRDVNLVFFPIIAHGHYYVIVFDLEKGHDVILDNSISDGDYDGKYKKNLCFCGKLRLD
ncbi:hypothetical protein CTI12_AA391610 [Artemisia annua]|uniref:Ubiquitin-like protease family profile domain-containing protein n=1 Tax=Artemisia annua TaxID=35608 RepID=A0A2U1MDU0_ARTAN|nr:hypothetical protein CTI12_AA391610 [Artemisia annua]